MFPMPSSRTFSTYFILKGLKDTIKVLSRGKFPCQALVQPTALLRRNFHVVRKPEFRQSLLNFRRPLFLSNIYLIFYIKVILTIIFSSWQPEIPTRCCPFSFKTTYFRDQYQHVPFRILFKQVFIIGRPIRLEEATKFLDLVFYHSIAFQFSFSRHF